MSLTVFQKGDGTSGIRGQLYETKIISLIFFNSKHDDNIEKILICANIAEAGAFDDICFQVEWKGLDKPVNVFIQAKHKDDCEQNLDFDLMRYFRSYLKIRESFERGDKDGLFQGKYQERECFFIIYTCGKINVGKDCDKNDYVSKVSSLIDTGGKVTKLGNENVEVYVKVAVNNDTISLAQQIAAVISGEKNYDMMLSDEVVLRYHVILAETVVNVSEIKPDGHRIATFRHDFFDTNDEYLILFKKTLNKEILKRQNINPADKEKLLSEFLTEPTDATKLSKLIGTVLTYNDGELDVVGNSTEDLKQQWSQANVSRWTINQAVELAAKEFLLSREFKVLASFGNKDLTIRGSDAKVEKRLNHLATKMIELLDNSKATKLVTIDESLEAGFLQLNGGIAGAIGNIFVLDDNTKLYKITDNCESLGPLAKKLYKKINDGTQNLHEYKFIFKVKKFPKLSFNCREHEESLAEDFFDRLLFYSGQKNEKGVEDILKHHIDKYLRDHTINFQVKTDAVFLKYHDKIQEWWMLPKQAPYLKKSDDIFEKAINDIIRNPLMSSLNMLYIGTIKYDYTFSDDAVSSLSLQDQYTYGIETDNCALTVIKVMQYLKEKKTIHVVLNLKDIVVLSLDKREALYEEIMDTNNEMVRILVSDTIENSYQQLFIFVELMKVAENKTTIFIMNHPVKLKIAKNWFPRLFEVHDRKNSLIDMSEESQKRILENTRVIFQGEEVKLALIVDDESKAYVKGDILNNVILKQTIAVGSSFILGPDEKNPDFAIIPLRPLDSITVVVETTEPQNSTRTLLTHLALETKKEDPKVWILRIDLSEYTPQFSIWKRQKTIDKLEALKFMCQVVLQEESDEKYEIVLEDNENNEVYLNSCKADPLIEFELKLFLRKFNQREVIFLFHDFDEIYPLYGKVVIKLLKSVSCAVSENSPKQKIWISSRSYKKVKSVLEKNFGPSYEIEYFWVNMKICNFL